MTNEAPTGEGIEKEIDREQIKTPQELSGPLAERLSLSFDPKQLESIKKEIFDKHEVSMEEVDMIDESLVREIQAKLLKFVEMSDSQQKEDLASEIADLIHSSAEMFV